MADPSLDRRLRELDRRWRASRDPADEAALLLERLRVGALSLERLELAAYLRHGAACAVLGDATPVGEHVPFEAWAEGFDQDGVRAAVGALAHVALAATSWPVLERRLAQPNLDALAAWLAGPDDEACDDLSRACETSQAPYSGLRGMHYEVVRIAVLAAWNQVVEPYALKQLCLFARGRRGMVTLSRAARRKVRDDLVGWALGAEHVDAEREPAGRKARAARGRRRKLVDEETAFLRSRVEAGDLEPARLEAAAFCGHEAARHAVGARLEAGGLEPAEWAGGLARFGPRVAACGVISFTGRTESWMWPIVHGVPQAARPALVEAMYPVQDALLAATFGLSWRWAPTPDLLAAVAGLERALAAPDVAAAVGRSPAVRALRRVLAIACAPGTTTKYDARAAVQATIEAWPADPADRPEDRAARARAAVIAVALARDTGPRLEEVCPVEAALAPRSPRGSDDPSTADAVRAGGLPARSVVGT